MIMFSSWNPSGPILFISRSGSMFYSLLSSMIDLVVYECLIKIHLSYPLPYFILNVYSVNTHVMLKKLHKAFRKLRCLIPASIFSHIVKALFR
jgi:hypothetical protein